MIRFLQMWFQLRREYATFRHQCRVQIEHIKTDLKMKLEDHKANLAAKQKCRMCEEQFLQWKKENKV